MKVIKRECSYHPAMGKLTSEIREGKGGKLELWRGYEGKQMFKVKLSRAELEILHNSKEG